MQREYISQRTGICTVKKTSSGHDNIISFMNPIELWLYVYVYVYIERDIDIEIGRQKDRQIDRHQTGMLAFDKR